MREQLSFTNDLYDSDIKIADLYKEMKVIERDVHFLRTQVNTAAMQNPIEYNKLIKLYNSLSGALDWMGDLLFYLDDASCDIENKSLDYYKRLAKMETPVNSAGIINTFSFLARIEGIERDIFHAFRHYYNYIVNAKPCAMIFEELDDKAREAVVLAKRINV
jgi:hypothetical protein